MQFHPPGNYIPIVILIPNYTSPPSTAATFLAICLMAVLGFANFYRQFIKNFSHMARPLNELKGKKEWKWEEEQQKAFDKLKDKRTSQPVLALPKREGKFQVETDASGYAIGGVLSQEQDGKWKPIVFLLRTMQPVERNYEIYNKELLAMVESITKWR